ncbi:hypothetical protein DFH08DRAFT_819799 [Mycena albidolilacea]|uniref:Uncharacterized protein n=1 Tax=Mycena albidolilacea TaxID=1033008 RepID=A0AAD7EEM5_9AGAR|nr:hypothetical protein DFH08DRAFT_819799 [Mycena albidolilacea]
MPPTSSPTSPQAKCVVTACTPTKRAVVVTPHDQFHYSFKKMTKISPFKHTSLHPKTLKRNYEQVKYYNGDLKCMAEPPGVNEAKHAQLFGSLFQSTGIFLGDPSLVEVHATHVFDAVAACRTEWAEEFSEPLRLRANILAVVFLHLVILCDDLQIYFLARDFTMEELAYIAADDPCALAKKDQVPETSYRMQNIPPQVVQNQALASPFSDPPSSLMEVEPVEESNVETQATKKRGIKEPREDGLDDEIRLWAPSRADSAHTR